jgi:hypothetical protein
MLDAARSYLRFRRYPDHVIAGGLDRLIANWESVAVSVGRGEPQEQDDYLNDADGRRIIADLWPHLPANEQEPVATRLAAADTLIRAHLIPTDECIWGKENALKYGYTRERDWWYFNRPKVVDPTWRTY